MCCLSDQSRTERDSCVLFVLNWLSYNHFYNMAVYLKRNDSIFMKLKNENFH